MIVEGPYGRFHKDEYADEIWIAGGIGITPFLGLAQDVSDNTDAKIDLYYSVSNKDEFIHLDELQELAYKNKNFRFFPWITSENGYLTLNHVAKHSKLLDKSFYLCGPTGMKEAFKQALHKKNIPVIRIHDERFAFK